MSADTFDTTTISASSATFSLHSEVEIDAPASLVYETFINTNTWPSWNSLSPQVNIIKHALDDQNQSCHIVINGAQITGGPHGAELQAISPIIREGTLLNVANTVQSSGLSPFSVFLCYDADAQERTVSWVYDSDMNPYPKAVMAIERTTEVQDLGNGRSRFRTLERQSGVKASYVKLRYSKALRKEFENSAQALKRYVEAQNKREE